MADRPTYDALAAALADMLRIIEAYRYSAGLGRGQTERFERAKAIAARAKSCPHHERGEQ